MMTCAPGASVPCPGSGNMCAGDQCCPATPGSGGTIPCPSASPSFASCQNNTKVFSCLAETTTTTTTTTTTMMTCAPGASVPCPGSGNMCAGDQCCPATPGSGGTIPCPSASPSFAS